MSGRKFSADATDGGALPEAIINIGRSGFRPPGFAGGCPMECATL
jgi:hypothetical protein